MEQRASIPPGLPRSQPTTSYWQDPPDVISDLRTTALLPKHVDIVIIGSGITGASIAYHLLMEQPELSIVLLEARKAASGASGRNGRSGDLVLPRQVLSKRPALGKWTPLF
jgi:ribulose 1,5-bisphosphate synthetase/thiazole synthase